METPICDFVRSYAADRGLRLHMPGHKGVGPLGIEALDITELQGADSLYEADGIIAQSERNASALFGCPTCYSTEGSSQCIRAMVYLAALHAKACGKPFRIAAARNVHQTFLSAVAMTDGQVLWLSAREQQSYLSGQPELTGLEHLLKTDAPTAVYLTSPDYLGNVTDIAAVSNLCHRYGALLLVDNAHGAYLKFLQPSRHPMDLGADLCCDSAHKTLPVLTGGAYLHVSPGGPAMLWQQAKNALRLFGSTSPSYLILQSLDAANRYLDQDYSGALADFLPRAEALRTALRRQGYCLVGNEPLKLTIQTKPYGYTGTELADILRRQRIECEFADRDYLVLMLTPALADLTLLEQALLRLPQKPAITEQPPVFHSCEQAMSLRQAILSPCVTLPVEACQGRILAAANASCPPAVPVLLPGQRIDREAIRCFHYYGIKTCTVVAF